MSQEKFTPEELMNIDPKQVLEKSVLQRSLTELQELLRTTEMALVAEERMYASTLKSVDLKTLSPAALKAKHPQLMTWAGLLEKKERIEQLVKVLKISQRHRIEKWLAFMLVIGLSVAVLVQYVLQIRRRDEGQDQQVINKVLDEHRSAMERVRVLEAENESLKGSHQTLEEARRSDEETQRTERTKYINLLRYIRQEVLKKSELPLNGDQIEPMPSFEDPQIQQIAAEIIELFTKPAPVPPAQTESHHEIERLIVRQIERTVKPTAIRDLILLLVDYAHNPRTVPDTIRNDVRIISLHMRERCGLDRGIEDRFSGPFTPNCPGYISLLKVNEPLWILINSQPEALRRAQSLLNREGFSRSIMNPDGMNQWEGSLTNRDRRLTPRETSRLGYELSPFTFPPSENIRLPNGMMVDLNRFLVSFYSWKRLTIPEEHSGLVDSTIVTYLQQQYGN